jgi:hypothetical protein
MSAKVAAYRVRVRNSMICMIRTGRLMKLPKKSVKTAEKNTSNGTLAKNKAVPMREESLFVSLDAVS